MRAPRQPRLCKCWADSVQGSTLHRSPYCPRLRFGGVSARRSEQVRGGGRLPAGPIPPRAAPAGRLSSRSARRVPRPRRGRGRGAQAQAEPRVAPPGRMQCLPELSRQNWGAVPPPQLVLAEPAGPPAPPGLAEPARAAGLGATPGPRGADREGPERAPWRGTHWQARAMVCAMDPCGLGAMVAAALCAEPCAELCTDAQAVLPLCADVAQTIPTLCTDMTQTVPSL